MKNEYNCQPSPCQMHKAICFQIKKIILKILLWLMGPLNEVFVFKSVRLSSRTLNYRLIKFFWDYKLLPVTIAIPLYRIQAKMDDNIEITLT